MSVAAMFRPGMRMYLIPLVAGLVLVVSAFLPWIVLEDVKVPGYPDVFALWIIGLGGLASTLALLSMITRKNSRHPLLLVGLFALGIMMVSWLTMPETFDRSVRSRAQAIAIVENTEPIALSRSLAGVGLYIGLAASLTIVGFGFTIVVRRVARPYAPSDPNDDV